MMITPISEYVKPRKKAARFESYGAAFGAQYTSPCVYVVSEDMQRMIKVGHTTNLGLRLLHLNTATAATVRVEAAVFVQDKREAAAFERAVQDRLRGRGLRVKGEWFAASDVDLREAFQSVLAGWLTPYNVVGLAAVQPDEEKLETPDYVDEFKRPFPRRMAGVGR